MGATSIRNWETRRRGGRTVSNESRVTYYDIPVIHKPHWKWSIVLYFFLGGIAGASYAIASIAHLVGGRDGRPVVRAGRYLSFAALVPSPLLLIYDLGRPDRFHHMLRVFKVRSPMSVGTWALTIFAVFSTISAAIQAAQDGLLGRDTRATRLLRALPTSPIGSVGTVFGFFVSGYTGVLLAATAVPLWTKNSLLMAPLFVASAMSNATAAISLMLSLVPGSNPGMLSRLERLDTITAVAKLGLILGLQKRSGPVIGRPMTTGRLGEIHRYGVISAGIIAPLTLQALTRLRGAHSRDLTLLGSGLTLLGGFLFRYVIVFAGNQSADDPEATFELTKGDRPS